MKTIIIKTDNKYIAVERNTIIAVEKKDNATLITAEHKEFIVNKPLTSFNLDIVHEFAMINRITIINLSKVVEYNSDGKIKVLINNGEIREYTVSRKYKKNFLNKFQQQSILCI